MTKGKRILNKFTGAVIGINMPVAVSSTAERFTHIPRVFVFAVKRRAKFHS